MGILNTAPDSFSDGGRWSIPDVAVKHALDMVDQGADLIDIGGESTRPGATPVSAEEEMGRLLPVLKELIPLTDVPVSVDTMKAFVAETCVKAGARIINDVSGLKDPDMLRVTKDLNVPIVLMSSYGNSSTFKRKTIPGDGNLYARTFLKGLIAQAHAAGVEDDMIITDPGIGFGTDFEQGYEMLVHSSDFAFGKYPVLIGPSRKRFVTEIFKTEDADDATAEACILAASSGADILRIHNVARIIEKF